MSKLADALTKEAVQDILKDDTILLQGEYFHDVGVDDFRKAPSKIDIEYIRNSIIDVENNRVTAEPGYTLDDNISNNSVFINVEIDLLSINRLVNSAARRGRPPKHDWNYILSLVEIFAPNRESSRTALFERVRQSLLEEGRPAPELSQFRKKFAKFRL